MNLTDPEYKSWLIELKSKIRSVQLKAAVAVNSALIEFYWELGKMIDEKQTAYGKQFPERLSKDLKSEFPDMKGLSRRNMFYARQFYQFYGNALFQQPIGKVQHTIGKLPWSHNILIFNKSENVKEANFKHTMPAAQSELAEQTLKDPYIFDFLTLAQLHKEKDIEGQLVDHVTKFLLEPNKGFAFLGRQRIQVYRSTTRGTEK